VQELPPRRQQAEADDRRADPLTKREGERKMKMETKTKRASLLALAALAILVLVAVVIVGCGDDGDDTATTMADETATTMAAETTTTVMDEMTAVDPATAPRASIDRFSMEAGTLQVRDESNGLPGPNEPVDFDQGPFITQGLGPNGEIVKYYNFDVQPTTAAPIYALFKEGEDAPVEGQLNIVGVIPGDPGYNDFWHVNKVTVPDDYVANSITNVGELIDSGYPIEATGMIVNCPVVPDGSTAELRLTDEDPGLTMGWYEDQVIYYFNFSEKMLSVTPPAEGQPEVPTADILVTFNVNPDQPNGGPASGFMTEMGIEQTHNVVATLPSDPGYSPLWDVDVYDNAEFSSVSDLASAQAAPALAMGVALVNCPIVSVEMR